MPRDVDPGQIIVGTGMVSNNSIDSNAFTQPVVQSQTAGLAAHINDPRGAHPASAISVDGNPLTNGGNVEDIIDELSALIPQRPPTIGNFSTIVGVSGIPDWGVLKLRDGGLFSRDQSWYPNLVPNNDDVVYPYYHVVPSVADDDPPFSNALGEDPQTDSTFNVVNGVYTGGGLGTSHLGGFRRTAGGPPNPLFQTARLLQSEGMGTKSFIVSGMVYPADRGVLALFYWPPGGDVAAFLAQDLDVRVVAAILLGQGQNDQGTTCDGYPGGIFTVDKDAPFDYPGLATGQYDLVELHTGLEGGTGPALPPPFNVADPGAGQVRLGTDASIGPVVAGGIPILGGTTSATGGGNDNNFFRYRLPYLDDYSSATGLKYTPTADKSRYFTKPAVSYLPGTDLTQAGDYTNFSKDYWTFQIARYRHRVTFPSSLPNPPDPRDVGSYILVHFRKESDFELFARDGTLPGDPTTCYTIYSAELTDWTDPEDSTNLTDSTATPAETSDGYHVLRALNYEDPEALDALVFSVSNFSYGRTADQVMSVSGVHYFVPGAAGSKWSILTMRVRATNYWGNSYRLSSDSSGGQVTAGLEGPDPAFVHLGTFSAESGNIVHAGAPDFDGTIGAERIEFGYDDLDESSTHGPFTLTNAPEPGDIACVDLTGLDPSITFSGDDTYPRFTEDAKIRWFFRSPIGHENFSTTLLPSQGQIVQPVDTKTILFHSTSADPSGGTGTYGNYNTGAIPSAARAGLENATKDVEERFLDEVYRYGSADLDISDPLWDGVRGQVAGPGLPFGASPILDFPVRAGSASSPWDAASWLQQGTYLTDISTMSPPEAQVAGLPDRNPPLSDGCAGSAPSSGICIYPKTDYSVGANTRPSTVDGDILTLTQPDYSGISTSEVRYVRALDAAFSRSGTPVAAEGQPFFTIRIRGLRLQDFQYQAPGPGNSNIAIEIKVPGLTTWMDLGRVDGSGPSKQDPFMDGAGCKVIDPQTMDTQDQATRVYYSDVRVNVGPAVNLFKNDLDEVPVLVRVRIFQAGSSLDFTQGGADGTSFNVRGLIGLEIVRPS